MVLSCTNPYFFCSGFDPDVVNDCQGCRGDLRGDKPIHTLYVLCLCVNS